ncbi:TPA: shikimate dehydrogenase [bacterium]|nr:shikimate dehydrogenase [bacterium]
MKKIVGIIGYPLGHTLSPIMHNVCFSFLGMDWIYVPFEVKPEGLKHAIFGLSNLGVVGVNVTIPYKIEVMKYTTRISKEVEEIGAVNTIVFKDGEIIGENTDGEGFVRSLKEAGFFPKGERIVLIGAGGAGRAIGVLLAKEGVKKIAIFDVEKEKAESLKAVIEKAYATEVVLEKETKDVRLLINATPLGMKNDDPLPIDPSYIHSGLLVCDVIYNPKKTKLLELAERKGAKIMNGIGMLVHQGALSFEKWTGIYPPTDMMRKVIEEKLC